jgi:hypothetical protein
VTTEQQPPPLTSNERSLARRLLHFSAPVRGAVVAGALAGFVSAGIGSRVVMRVITLLNEDHDGVMTDSSATVGDITLGGTMSLLLLGTIAGVLGGLLYLGLRRWLLVPAKWRGLAFAIVTLVTVGQPLFDTANVDFQIFEPVLVVVGMFAALFLINGLILAPLLDRVHPEPAYTVSAGVPTVVGGVIAAVCALGLLITVGTLQTMIDDAGTCFSAAGGGAGCAVFEQQIEK